jgi:hypothetical protein
MKNGQRILTNVQIAEKHPKRCSTSLCVMIMQIKITMKYHSMLTRVDIIKKTTASRTKAVDKLEPSHTADRKVK